MHLTSSTLTEVVHGLFVGGVVAVRFLWPLWLLIIALWLITRLLRAVGRFFGFVEPAKPARPAPRPRR